VPSQSIAPIGLHVASSGIPTGKLRIASPPLWPLLYVGSFCRIGDFFSEGFVGRRRFCRTVVRYVRDICPLSQQSHFGRPPTARVNASFENCPSHFVIYLIRSLRQTWITDKAEYFCSTACAYLSSDEMLTSVQMPHRTLFPLLDSNNPTTLLYGQRGTVCYCACVRQPHLTWLDFTYMLTFLAYSVKQMIAGAAKIRFNGMKSSLTTRCLVVRLK